MYLMVQSCLHVVINFLWPPEPTKICCICPLITGQYRILQNVCENAHKIRGNSVTRLKIPHSTENCGPYFSLLIRSGTDLLSLLILFLCFVLLGRPSIDVYLVEEHSYQISPQSDLKQCCLRFLKRSVTSNNKNNKMSSDRK